MIKRLVVWGGNGSDLDSLRWIMRSFYLTARKMGIDAQWVADAPENNGQLTPGTTVIAADRWGQHLRWAPGVDYVLHNFSGTDDICQALESTPDRLIRLQVWTNEASGETWDECRQWDRSARTLFQPWGSDLLPEEFLEPVYNPLSKEITFVGAIWADQYQGVELGNKHTMDELRRVCERRRLRLRHLTQVSDAEMILAMRSARLTPAFAGGWQVSHGYVPCRYFKAAAYGTLAFGNVPAAEGLLGAASISDGTVEGTLEEALGLSRGRYLNLVREQQRVAARYTYRSSLDAIGRALEEIKA